MSKVLLIFLLLLSGCSKKDEYTRLDYHNDLINYLNLDTEDDLAEFRIIDRNYQNQKLDSHYLLYTLSNYLRSPSKFEYENDEYIDYSIECGLIPSYKNEYVNREKAQQLFELATQIKEKNIGNYNNSIYKEGFDEESEIDEIFEEIDFEYNDELDLNKAEIVEYFNYVPNELTEDENYRMLGETLASKSYNYNDYKITYVVTDSDIKVKVENEKLNGKFYLQSEINNLKLKTKLKAKDKEDYTYFKIDFQTEESLGFKKGTFKDSYGDLKNVDKNDILNSLSKMFKTKSEIAETSIELFEIKIPIDTLGAIKVTLQVKLHFYASGRIELTFNTTNSYGFERVNGNVRFINQMDKSMDFVAKASSDATTSLTAGLKSGKTRIADVRFEAGVSGFIKNSIHIFDNEKMTSYETKLPGDYVAEMLEDDEDFKVCSDLSLYWLLKVTINSSGSLLQKIGLSHTYDVFKDNKQLIKGPIHLENFLEVEKCTVKNKTLKQEEKIEISKEKLIPDYYFKSLKVNQSASFTFKEIPEGINEKDLIYTSNDPNIARIENGILTGFKKGSTEISIISKDQKYKTSVSVLVNE